MFSKTYDIRYSDYKDFDTVKVSSVLDIVQEISVCHSAFLGYDVNKLRSLGVAWLIQGLNVHFEDKVSTNCAIEAFTAVKSTRLATSERGCILKQNGKVVCKTIANWFLFDSEKGSIAKISPEMQAAYPIYDFNDDFFTYKKPALIKDAPEVYSIRVSNKEIDTNMHLNNQKSAELLMDALPFDYEFTDISILYKKPALLGDVLKVCCTEISDGYYVHLASEDGDICVAGTFRNGR